jgi:hypothetical protein
LAPTLLIKSVSGISHLHNTITCKCCVRLSSVRICINAPRKSIGFLFTPIWLLQFSLYVQ